MAKTERKGTSRSTSYATYANRYLSPTLRGAVKYGVKRALKFSERKSNRRRRRRRPQTVNYRTKKRSIKAKLDKVCQFVKSRCATHIRRVRFVSRCLAASNSAPLCFADYGGTITQLENAMANLRYFNPATNTMVIADPSVGTYNRDIVVAIYRKLELRNNYHVPVKVTMFACVPKTDTSISAFTAYTNGLVDQGNPLPSSSPLLKITDSHELNDLWNLKRVVKKTLQPGQSCFGVSSTPAFPYNLATVDEQTMTFQRKYGGHGWLFKIEGVLGHDSIATEQGVVPCGVDMLADITYKFTYDAGKDVHDISIFDNAQEFTNVGRISSKPLTAQQNYLVT